MMLPTDPQDRERFLAEQRANGGYTKDNQRSHEAVDIVKTPEYAGNITPGLGGAYQEGPGSLRDSQSPEAKISRGVLRIIHDFRLSEDSGIKERVSMVVTEMMELIDFDESKFDPQNAKNRLKMHGIVK